MLDPALLSRVVRYEPDTGCFFWRPRSIDLFAELGTHMTHHQSVMWNAKHADRETGISKTALGYRYFQLNGKNISAHRAAIAISTLAWPENHVDHIDGNPSNNRLSNLRGATRHQNLRNQKKRTGVTTSQFKGVYFHKRARKWVAQAQAYDSKKYLGLFCSEEDAAKAYDAFAAAEFGEFARLNFPDDNHAQ